jgi:hypothetical protein
MTFPWRLAIGLVPLLLAVALAFNARSSSSTRRASHVTGLGPLVTPVEEVADLQQLGRDAIELVASIRPPTSVDGRVRIVTYLRLPRGASIATRWVDGAPTVEVPPGTFAARVEALAERAEDEVPGVTWRVLDVRATSFEEGGGERFRMLRPDPGGRLSGITWPASEEGRRQADAAIVRFFEQGAFTAVGAGAAAAAAKLVKLNDCASCHGKRRGENRSPSALVQKRTDSSGLFHVLAALSDDGPFERYRPRDANAHDPFIRARCGGQIVPSSLSMCEDGLRPEGHLDLEAALAAGDVHARRVCESRLALAARMDETGRRAFHSAWAPCAAMDRAGK